MNERTIDFAFPQAYEVEIEPDERKYADTRFYSGISDLGHLQPLEVGVIPLHGDRWLGKFNFGSDIAPALSGVFSSPNPEKICVVAGGQAYIVQVRQPRDWEVVQIPFPVTQVVPAPTSEILIFVDFVRVAGFGPDGVAWVTPEISFDGIEILSANGGEAKGRAWSAPEERMVDFSIDLATGRHQGGAEGAD